MVAARDSPDGIAQWIALVDAAEAMRVSAAYMPGRHADVEVAILALVAYEHTMIPQQRQAAREQIWRRDHAPEPLPDTRAWWAECTCRACRLARRAAPADRYETARQAQARTVKKQQKKGTRTWQER